MASSSTINMRSITTVASAEGTRDNQERDQRKDSSTSNNSTGADMGDDSCTEEENVDALTNTTTTSTMLLLMNAVAECRNKNVKKACVEFNESYNKATYSNDDLFTSKLLEMSFGDLELLYQTVCSIDSKSRRSSKQHDGKNRSGNSFKKKSSISDTSSFANAAYEGGAGSVGSSNGGVGEMRSSTSSSSLGRKRSQVSLSDQENIQGKSCLRKAYMLIRDLNKPEYQNTQSEAFLTIAQIHLKAENFYSCTVLCVEFKDKFTVERFLDTLDPQQVERIAEFCVSITSSPKESGAGSVVDLESRIQFAKMALKLRPNSAEPSALLCNLYRLNNETEKALAIVKVYLEEVNETDEYILALKSICITDNSKYAIAISNLECLLTQHPESRRLSMVLSIVYVLKGESEKGMEVLDQLQIQSDNTEDKKLFASLLELLKLFNLQLFAKELYNFLTTFSNGGCTSKDNEKPPPRIKNIRLKKTILSLAARLLAYKHENKFEIAKLYVDCLHFCDNLKLAQDFLVKMVKEYPDQTLPMVYLANIRLKVGAYLASTEDFRGLLKLYGEENLTNDLAKLPLEERKEIARVHRLHGVRFLGNEYAFREAAECFTVVLCAIGSLAPGLFLSRGYCFMHLNDFTDADKDFKACLEKNEFVTAALCARAVLYAVTTHVEEALRDFKKAFATDPTACQKCLPKLPYEHVTVFSQMIIQYVKQAIQDSGLNNTDMHQKGRARGALCEITQINNTSEIQQSSPPSESTTTDLSSTVTIEPVAATAPRIDSDILRFSEFLCKVFPGNTEYVSTYIECLYLSNDKATMTIAIERALEAFPGEKRFVAWKGVALSEQKQNQREAINCLRTVCFDATDDILHVFKYLDANYNNNNNNGNTSKRPIFDQCMKKGRRCAGKERYEDAVSYFSLAAALSAKDVIPLRERAECFRNTGNHKKWLVDMSRILTLDPTTRDYCVRASHHHAQGEDLSACEDYINALSLDETETVQLVTMNSNTEGVTYLFHTTALSLGQINKTKSAQRLCEAGLRFDPNHKELRQLVDKTTVNKCTIQ